MKIIFEFTLPIARDDYDDLMWYHRDAKRIRRKITWDSGVYQKTEDGKYIIYIYFDSKNADLGEYWIVDMVANITTGRTRVTPIRQVDCKKFLPCGDSSNFYIYK